MILLLWLVFVGISLILVVIGLMKSTESAQALIGFFFLFLLAFVVLGNNLEYHTGEITNTSYVYVANSSNLNYTTETTTNVYSTYNDTTGIFNTHRFGYFMAVASAVGLVGVLISLKGLRRREDE